MTGMEIVMKKMKRKYIVMFLAIFFIAYLFPYTGDDWAWGSQIGIERLSTWFDNYSGRYFGNIIVLFLTRSHIIRTIFMTVCLSGIVIILNKLSGEHKIGFYIILSCFLFMPVNVLRQSIVWTAGFSNYTTSIFFTLIYIYYIRNFFGKEKPRYSLLSIIPLFIGGFLNALIVEHMTFYNVVMSIFVIIYVGYKFKKVYFQHIAYMIGSVLGTIYMFSNTVYRSVANGQDGYRTIGSDRGLIQKILDSYLNVIVQEGILNNVLVNIFLLIVCIVLWREIKNNLNNIAYAAGEISLNIICAYVAYSFMNSVSNISELNIMKYVQGVATIIYLLALFVFLIVLPISDNIKAKLIFIICSIACMIAPLFVVSPIGSRCFFSSYIMFIYLIIELFNQLSEERRKRFEYLAKYIRITAIIGFLYLSYIYGTIFVADAERINKAIYETGKGKKTIVVENLPYDEYVWCSVPQEGTVWEERFKLFYGIDEKVKITNTESHFYEIGK